MVNFWCNFYLGFKNDLYEWLEGIAIAAISLVIWVYSDAYNLDIQGSSFFWPLLGPILVALRYGFGKGLFCAILVVAGVAQSLEVAQKLSQFPFGLAVGTVLSAMLAGEFRDYWFNINQKNQLERNKMSQRLDSFTRNYQLLKTSHDQLEQHVAGQRVSLRTCISSLQQVAERYPDHRLKELAEPLLNLFADLGGLQVAGLYGVTGSGIHPQAYAVLGDKHKLVESDEMLRAMLRQRKLMSPAKLQASEIHLSRYQLCIPLCDARNVLQGFILAETVRFSSLTQANNAFLSLTASHAGDLLSNRVVTPVLKPGEFGYFMDHFNRAKLDVQEHSSESCVVLFYLKQGSDTSLFEDLCQRRRGPDIYWMVSADKANSSMVVLLPLTSKQDADLFLRRMVACFAKENSHVRCVGPFSVSSQSGLIGNLLTGLEGKNDDTADFSG